MGGHPMAITVFLLLVCLGLVFLIHALVNFRKELRRHENRSHSPIPWDEHNFGVRITPIPVVFTSKDQNSVIPLPARHRQADLSPGHQREFAKPIEMQRRVVSEPRASQGGK
jgi:uncharacterized membrane protein